jgi:hypothetical protein
MREAEGGGQVNQNERVEELSEAELAVNRDSTR